MNIDYCRTSNLISGIVLLLATIFVSGCDSDMLWEDGPYQVIYIDTPNNISLCYKVTEGGCIRRIGPTILEVGSNDKYVMAKTCTNSECYYYYIIRLMDNGGGERSEIKKAVMGPFSAKDINNIRKRIELPNLKKLF